MSPKGRKRQVEPSIRPTCNPNHLGAWIEAVVCVAVCRRAWYRSSRGKRCRASLKEVVASEVNCWDKGALPRGAQAVGATRAGIFDDMAKGVLVAEPLEQEVPERDEGCKSPLIKGQFRKIQPGSLQELGKVALEFAGGEAGA